MKQNLYVKFAGSAYEFIAEPIEKVDGEPQKFAIDMKDGNPRIMAYDYTVGWHLLEGRDLYTDLLLLMGYTIQERFPDYF